MRILPPDAETPRQSAFSQNLDSVIGAYGQYDKAQKNKGATKRQQAMQNMNMAMNMQKQGYDVSPEQIGEQFAADDRTTLQKMFGDDPAAKPDIGSLLANRTDAYTQGKEREAADLVQDRESKGLDFKLKQAKVADLDKDYGETQAGKKFEYEQGLKNESLIAKGERAKTKDLREREIPGLGIARTKKEAQEVRKADTAVRDAGNIIDKIKELGTNVAVWDREKINLIEQAKQALAGKLRLPLTGPGILTETEFNRLIDNMGDPSNVGSLESIELAKLDQLKEILNDSIKSHFSAVSESSFDPAQSQKSKISSGQGMPKIKGVMYNKTTGEPKLSVKLSELSDEDVAKLIGSETSRRGTANAR